MAVNNGWGVLLNLMPIDWLDLIVLSSVAAAVAEMRRRILAISTVLLFTVSFPPFSWPTWWFCLAPLVWLWRDQDVKLSRLRLTTEAVMIGFAMAWVSTGFVRASLPAYGWLIHAAACLVFSLQVVAAAVAIRFLRNQPVFIAGAISALTLMVGEFFEAMLCAVVWSVTNMALTVGATPLAQWSRWITPFGVSGGLYLVNFLLIPESSARLMRRWMGPAMSVGILALTWCGGVLLAANVSVEPLPFSVVLVQPHLKPTAEDASRPWLPLDQLTRTALLSDDAVDLIVWPETSLSESWSPEQPSGVNDMALRLTVQDYAQRLTPLYATNSLVGGVVAEVGTTRRYGLDVAAVRRYNCGYLVSTRGEITRHEKLHLVPLKESLPRLLDFAWIRHRGLPMLQLNPQLAYGRDYRPLSFRDHRGIQRSIAVAVCYESLLPWLPQYGESADVDAIIHLVYDGHSAEHPGVMQRQIRACQYRAIETRKWNLVCSTWSGSTIIDPSGRIVRQLSATAGVLQNNVAQGKGI